MINLIDNASFYSLNTNQGALFVCLFIIYIKKGDKNYENFRL